MNKTLKRSTVISVIFMIIMSSAFMLTAVNVCAKAKSDRPGTVTGLKVSQEYNKINLTWKKVKGAKKYIVYVKVNSGNWKKYKTVKKNKLSYSASKNATYKFMVQAKNKKKGKKSATKKIDFKYFIKLKSKKNIVVHKRETFTVKIQNPGDIDLKWTYDNTKISKANETISGDITSTSFTTKKTGKANIKISGGKYNNLSIVVGITKDPSDLDYPNDKYSFSAKVINPDGNKLYNGAGVIIPIYYKTDASYDDYLTDDGGWVGYIIPASDKVTVDSYYYYYDIPDEWDIIMKRGLTCYDIHYKDPNANAMKMNADYSTVDNGHITGECYGSLEDPDKADKKAGNYKIVVIDWDTTGEYAKVRSISDTFHLYNISTRYNEWLNKMEYEAKDCLTCIADYSPLIYKELEDNEALAKRNPELKIALEYTKTLWKNYYYSFLFREGSHFHVSDSIRNISKPQFEQNQICGGSTMVLMALLEHHNIKCKGIDTTFAGMPHANTGVIVNGTTYEINSAYTKRYVLYPEERRIFNNYTKTNTYYNYITLG